MGDHDQSPEASFEAASLEAASFEAASFEAASFETASFEAFSFESVSFETFSFEAAFFEAFSFEAASCGHDTTRTRLPSSRVSDGSTPQLYPVLHDGASGASWGLGGSRVGGLLGCLLVPLGGLVAPGVS